MHFLLSTLTVVYVIITFRPPEQENELVATTRERQNWDNANYICKRHILKCLTDGLFSTYQNEATTKELWDKLEARYVYD